MIFLSRDPFFMLRSRSSSHMVSMLYARKKTFYRPKWRKRVLRLLFSIEAAESLAFQTNAPNEDLQRIFSVKTFTCMDNIIVLVSSVAFDFVTSTPIHCSLAYAIILSELNSIYGTLIVFGHQTNASDFLKIVPSFSCQFSLEFSQRFQHFLVTNKHSNPASSL